MEQLPEPMNKVTEPAKPPDPLDQGGEPMLGFSIKEYSLCQVMSNMYVEQVACNDNNLF